MKPIRRPKSGLNKPLKRTKDAEKLKKITKNKLQTLRKHKLGKPLKSLAIIWFLCVFVSNFIYTN